MSDKDKWGQIFGGDAPAKSKAPELVVNQPLKPSYNAFDTQDKLLGFTVHCPSVKVGHQFFYHHLHTITFNEPDYTFLFITTSTSVIRVYGHNLQSLTVALGLHTCKSFTEFHKDLFTQPPTDDGKAFIEKIDVALIKGAELPQAAAGKNGEGT
jgi:hypothetical protein